jgi:hypothetical protein
MEEITHHDTAAADDDHDHDHDEQEVIVLNDPKEQACAYDNRSLSTNYASAYSQPIIIEDEEVNCTVLNNEQDKQQDAEDHENLSFRTDSLWGDETTRDIDEKGHTLYSQEKGQVLFFDDLSLATGDTAENCSKRVRLEEVNRWIHDNDNVVLIDPEQ